MASSSRQLHPVTLALAVMVTAAATLSSAQQQQQQQPEAFPALPCCSPAPLSLSPCIGYVFGVSTATLAACCSQLRSFLLAQAPCLCAASKLAPSPVGLILGQAQTIIPNVCHLPNPCDADAGDGEGSAPAAAGDSPPSETTPAATTTPATEEPSSSTAAADPDASGASPEPAEDSSGTATAPAGAGYKLPQLLHAAGAARSRGMTAGTVFVTVFLASVAAMSV